MRLRNTAIAIGVGVATAAGLSLLKPDNIIEGAHNLLKLDKNASF